MKCHVFTTPAKQATEVQEMRFFYHSAVDLTLEWSEKVSIAHKA